MTLDEKLVANGYQQEAFKAYLIANASETLTEKIIAGDKNIADAELFIAGEILKENKYVKNGQIGMSTAEDEFIFGQLIHYFEEDSIAKADVSALKGVKVSTPSASTGLSKEQAVILAKKEIEAEYKAELKKAAEEEKKAKEQAKLEAAEKKRAEQEAKKKAEELIKEETQTTLFDFI